MWKVIVALVVAFAAFASQSAAAQSWDIGALSRQRSEALAPSNVTRGVVLQVRNVQVEPSGSTNMAALGIGGALGAALGSRVGGGNARYVAGALGGILGALGGRVASNSLGGTTAQAVVVKLGNGQLTSITQSESNLRPGEQVLLIQTNGRVRVVPSLG